MNAKKPPKTIDDNTQNKKSLSPKVTLKEIKILEDAMDWICLNQPMTYDDGTTCCVLYDEETNKCTGIPSACEFCKARKIIQKLKKIQNENG